MVVFQDIQDLEEWLEPLDYISFWEAIGPYQLVLQDRDHCDGLIAGAIVAPDLVLHVLKALAVMELRRAFGLKDRIHIPVVAQYLGSTH